MPARLPSGAAVRLLAVLCVTAGCAAAQQQQQQQPSARSGGVTRLRDIIEQTVQAKLQPLVSRLDESKIESLESRLGLRMHALDRRLESKIESLENRIESIEQTVRDELQPRVSRLESKIELLEGRHESRIDTLDSRLDTQKSQLDGLVSKVDGQKSQLDSLTTRLGRQESELTRLVTKLDGQQSQLAVLTETSSSEQTQLDRSTNKTASQQTQIDVLTARLDRVESEGGPGDIVPLPRDCSDLPSGAQSGIHLLQLGLDRSQSPVPAFCDLDKDGGNWTVIQRCADIKPRQDFFRDWAAYREGFGELDAEFWWGLGHLWTVTSARDRQYELHVNLDDFEGETRHAVYQGFQVSSEEGGYWLTLGEYSGDAGDSLQYHANRKFSTHDRDQGGHSSNCAEKYKGGWWYGACYHSNLNGRYQYNPIEADDEIGWDHWRGSSYSMKNVEMKIRPRTRSY